MRVRREIYVPARRKTAATASGVLVSSPSNILAVAFAAVLLELAPEMKNQSRNGNHPMQPLSPKKQPWVMARVSSRPKDLARSTKFAKEATAALKPGTVQQELLLREKIEERAMLKLEKHHDAVSLDRQARRIQREKASDDAGKILKALQEQKFKRSLSL